MRRATTVLVTVLFGVAMMFAVSGQSLANPAIAKKTGKACGACHTTPPALNAAGQKYKAGMKK
jgi:cytochrome c553